MGQVVTGATFVTLRGGTFTALKVRTLYPLVLVVATGWRQSRAVGIGLLGVEFGDCVRPEL